VAAGVGDVSDRDSDGDGVDRFVLVFVAGLAPG
jgi:hypothetical protein